MARRLAESGVGGAPAERGARSERGVRLEGAGKERLCTKHERDTEGESTEGKHRKDFEVEKNCGLKPFVEFLLVGEYFVGEKCCEGEKTETRGEDTIGFRPKRFKTQRRG